MFAYQKSSKVRFASSLKFEILLFFQILIDNVMARLRPDFQAVMKKDLMKKFIEQVAYKKMEEWYEHKLFVFKGNFFVNHKSFN